MTKIIGITGSIGVGKTTISKIISGLGYLVFDADLSVSIILEQKALQEELVLYFPEVFVDNKINKKKLREIVFFDDSKLAILESIVHPVIRIMVEKFIQENQKEDIIFLEIPLLYEQEYDLICDEVIVIYTDFYLQSERVLMRDGMTNEMFLKILSKQKPEEEKKSKADYLIYNNSTNDMLVTNIKKIVKEIKRK